MKRQKGFMSDDTFALAVAQAKELGVPLYNLFLFGEPFIDTKIYERVDYVKRVVPGANIGLYSNLGVPIDEDKAHLLSGMYLVISYTDGADVAIRDRNVQILKDAGVGMCVHVVATRKPSPVLPERFVTGARQFSTVHGLECYHFGKYNWRGRIKSTMQVVDGICQRPGTAICVLWDGRVNLCCMDIEGEMILGDVHTSTLKQIWESDLAREFRETRKFDLDFCRNCNMQVF
jgi:radical SAM protein with 4Fe4S-binding SPASM domain